MEYLRRPHDGKKTGYPALLVALGKIALIFIAGTACLVVTPDPLFHFQLMKAPSAPPIGGRYLDQGCVGNWSVTINVEQSGRQGSGQGSFTQTLTLSPDGRYKASSSWMGSKRGYWYNYNSKLYFEPANSNEIYVDSYAIGAGALSWGSISLYGTGYGVNTAPPPPQQQTITAPPPVVTPVKPPSTVTNIPAAPAAPQPQPTRPAVHTVRETPVASPSVGLTTLPGTGSVKSNIPARLLGRWSRLEVSGAYEYLIYVTFTARSVNFYDPIHGNRNGSARITGGKLAFILRGMNKSYDYSISADGRTLVFGGKTYQRGLIRAPGRRLVRHSTPAPTPKPVTPVTVTPAPTPQPSATKPVIKPSSHKLRSIPVRMRGSWSRLESRNRQTRRVVYTFGAGTFKITDPFGGNKSGEVGIFGGRLALVIAGKQTLYTYHLNAHGDKLVINGREYRRGLVAEPVSVTPAPAPQPAPPPVVEKPAVIVPAAPTVRGPLSGLLLNTWVRKEIRKGHRKEKKYSFTPSRYTYTENGKIRGSGAAWVENARIVLVEKSRSRYYTYRLDAKRKRLYLNGKEYRLYSPPVQIKPPHPEIPAPPAAHPVTPGKPSVVERPVVTPPTAPAPPAVKEKPGKPSLGNRPVTPPAPAPAPAPSPALPSGLKDGVPAHLSGLWSQPVKGAGGKWGLRIITFSGKLYKFSSSIETSRRGWVKHNATVIVLERKGTRPEILSYSLSADRKTLRLGGWTLTRGRARLPK